MADRAVLFGINDYKSIGDLSGCVNDVNNVRRLLIESFGFPEDSIRTFTNKKVTKKAIEGGFDWLVDGADTGDRLVFHFSGHGSYTTSEDSDEEVDELLCLHGMDWDDRGTYLIDDDLGKLADSVAPTGARLTIILDCCHSGSGTRALAIPRSARRKARLVCLEETARQAERGETRELVESWEKPRGFSSRSLKEKKVHPVYARFVEPPQGVQRAKRVAAMRRLGDRARSTAQLNHQLLAAAKDTQTAADAFLDGEYNGAFTFHMCMTARELGPGATVNSVMKQAGATIAQKFSQIPQNEGPFGSEPLFGGGPTMPIESDADQESAPFVRVPSEDATGSLERSQALRILDRFLRVTDKLVDLVGTAEPSGMAPLVEARATGEECVVYVHGISRHLRGYSLPWYEAMQPHLSQQLERHEVLWSQHVNPRSAARSVMRSDSPELVEFVKQIEQEFEARTSSLERRIPPSSTRTAPRMERARGSGFAIDDFARYMLDSSTRSAILEEFDDVMLPLLRSGRRIHVVSHSWGTVVAYEGLRRLDQLGLSGRICNLFVAGSALSIGVVQSDLFGRVTDGRLPAHVDRMINLDAGGDIVGGGIGDEFTVHREFLGLEPVTCSQIPLTDIAFNPACAHGSYFQKANREVNRDIFARFIRSSH